MSDGVATAAIMTPNSPPILPAPVLQSQIKKTEQTEVSEALKEIKMSPTNLLLKNDTAELMISNKSLKASAELKAYKIEVEQLDKTRQ